VSFFGDFLNKVSPQKALKNCTYLMLHDKGKGSKIQPKLCHVLFEWPQDKCLFKRWPIRDMKLTPNLEEEKRRMPKAGST